MFDTHQAAKELHLPTLSLAYLLKTWCNIDASKQFQLADWRLRLVHRQASEGRWHDASRCLGLCQMNICDMRVRIRTIFCTFTINYEINCWIWNRAMPKLYVRFMENRKSSARRYEQGFHAPNLNHRMSLNGYHTSSRSRTLD